MPQDLVSQLRAAHGNSDGDDFWTLWSSGAECGLLRPYSGAGGPVSWVVVGCVFVSVALVVALSVESVPAGFTGSVRGMMLMSSLLSSLLTPLLLM